ncbi:hypothetical protein GPA09_04755 [Burkholderia pseudomallei]|nr:hypothetical protein [Burkholderia pseudomallei]
MGRSRAASSPLRACGFADERPGETGHRARILSPGEQQRLAASAVPIPDSRFPIPEPRARARARARASASASARARARHATHAATRASSRRTSSVC